MTKYDFDRMKYDKIPPLTKNQLDMYLSQIRLYIEKAVKNNDIHFLLLSNELRYYTMFQLIEHDNIEILLKQLIKTIEFLGNIIDVTFNEGFPCFWVKTKEDEQVHMFAFFDYENGVIYC